MKVFKRVAIPFFSLVLLFFSFHFFDAYYNNPNEFSLKMEVSSLQETHYQMFYSDDTNNWTEDKSARLSYDHPGEWMKLKFSLPKSHYVRIDFGDTVDNTVTIRGLEIKGNSGVIVDLGTVELRLNQAAVQAGKQKNTYQLRSTGNDPFIYFDASSYFSAAEKGRDLKKNVISIIFSLLVAGGFYLISRYAKESIQFIKDFINNRTLVLNLAKNDFKTKYASSYLGVLWGFINPLLTITTYWFVFQVGLRSGNMGQTPFIIWFIAGIIPWFFFSDALSSSTNAFIEYNYLVKKVVFKVELLPLVKIFSAFFIQMFFVIFIFAIYSFYGIYPTLYSIQLIYYIVALFALVVSLSLMTSSVLLFFKDLNQIISVILQMGFWFTPIGWSISMLSDFWGNIFKLNPMFYIVQGYRDTLIDHIWFTQHPYQTVYFWLFCLVSFTVGHKIFKRLKPHFPDVL
ncbi:ABC transporter permease [Gorillibacterium timonense]|uniref:ABC transporter permease n=1 Tax=Gorillibacterium timonense TaxID=1689269 RepID=UPI0009E9DF4B|nr:ABC transporter permease [Gorillibacterium timonense]